MTHLIEILIRYSKSTNIPLSIENESIDLSVFFIEAYNRGYMSTEVFEDLKSILVS